MSHATFTDVLLSMEIEKNEPLHRQRPRPVIIDDGGKRPSENDNAREASVKSAR